MYMLVCNVTLHSLAYGSVCTFSSAHVQHSYCNNTSNDCCQQDTSNEPPMAAPTAVPEQSIAIMYEDGSEGK